MSYNIEYTEQAQRDLEGIYQYIAFELKAPDTAANLYKEFIKSIRGLDNLPMRNPLVDEEPWKKLGLRKLLVKNYIVFYTTDESKMRVTVVRIMYGGRNIEEQLKE